MLNMMSVLNAYIDINILLLLALALWLVARKVLKFLGLKHAYTTQLRLINMVFLGTLVLPVLVTFVSGLMFPNGGTGANLSDFMVAQYLHGSFEMNAGVFESLLGFRQWFTSTLINQSTLWAVILGGVIGLGMLVSTANLGYGFWRLRRLIRASHKWRQIGKLNLYLSDSITVPFSTRSWRKRIVVIPSNMLASPDTLKMVLSHEFQHLRQSDLEWEITLEFLKPLFFWNPAFYIWKRNVETLRELACDQSIITTRNIDVAAYCACLLEVCQNSLRKRKLFSVGVPRIALVETRHSTFGPNAAAELKRRFNALLECNPQQCSKAVLALVIAGLLSITVLASLAMQKPNDWSHDRLMLSSIINLENLERLNSQHLVVNN